MKNFHYMERETALALRVRAKRIPSSKTVPKSGTWVIYEWSHEKKRWFVAGEINFGSLQKLFYLGATRDPT